MLIISNWTLGFKIILGLNFTILIISLHLIDNHVWCTLTMWYSMRIISNCWKCWPRRKSFFSLLILRIMNYRRPLFFKLMWTIWSSMHLLDLIFLCEWWWWHTIAIILKNRLSDCLVWIHIKQKVLKMTKQIFLLITITLLVISTKAKRFISALTF
jgi:hypothetical protein